MVTLHRLAASTLGLSLALGALFIAGCGGSSGSSGGAVGAANPGQLQVLLADAPLAGLDAVNVTITKVEALYDGEADSRLRQDDDRIGTQPPSTAEDTNDQWVTLSTETRTVNLLDFANQPAGALFNLLHVGVPSGHYKQFRFTVAAVDVVALGSHITPVLDQNAVVLPCDCFVSPRENEVMVLDFDAAASLALEGALYHFNPALRLMQQDHAATVSGTVQFQASTPVTTFQARVELLNATGQVVGHGEVEADLPTPQSTAQATFVIHAVPPGTYAVQVMGEQGYDGLVSGPQTIQANAGQTAQTAAFMLAR